ncbi:hypothetical protein TREMEDRAFT_25515, partial [Tremella mesenterica DSM 1558]|uniref:uncharacterized protein n=1 Tax=Tremella mesenterica (strain ATCC 24925 / CBS 8224 / DSM 1558 / NBRC 9311 / NRRL Y-6157 / RJB 2259-6 / UBC 559-6) TaxID=578456 RepID=UPI0003F495EE
QSHTVEMPVDVKDALRKFRFKKATATTAISIKIIKAKLTMAVDEEFSDLSIEEIAEELPENSPRYVIISHELKHRDGRISQPLVLINWQVHSLPLPNSMGGSPTDLMTLHASSLSYFQQTAEVAKVVEVRDGAEGLTTEVVDERLLAA